MPAMLLAVAVTLATPEALVNAVGLDSTALAPVGGAAKTTVAPVTGLPSASFRVACSVLVKGEPMGVDCGVPPVAVMNANVVLVNENVAFTP